MIRYIVAFLLFVHGMIHILGFAKAFSIGEIPQLTKHISKSIGILWFLTMVLFAITTIFFLYKKDYWWAFGIAALVLSQILIIVSWQDAKYGTIANLIILPAILIGFFSWNFRSSYQKDVNENLLNNSAVKKIVTEKDLQKLPPVVQKYLRYTNVVNKEGVSNFKVIFNGEMRGKDKKWFTFKSEQYNFTDAPTRLFFMDAIMKKLPFAGYHRYREGKASMTIKLISQYPIVDLKNDELNRAETVTYFNDLCLMAPGALIDDRIQWGTSDSSSAIAMFTTNGISISAVLYFNEKGQLINFVSDDRYDTSGGQPVRHRFSTPVKEYKNVNGINVVSYGEAVWHYPEGDFVYGKFYLESIQYNLKSK